MRYISTRGNAPVLSFEDAMMTGLARDGGLYVPESWPEFTRGELAMMAGKSYQEIAVQVMRPFVCDTFGEAEFEEVVDRAYAGFAHPAIAPVKQLSLIHI